MRVLRPVLIALALLVALCFALTRGAPQLPVAVPNADDIAVAKSAFDPIRGRDGTKPVELMLHDAEIAAGGKMAGNALAPGRASARYDQGQLIVYADYPLPFGRWLSGQAYLSQGKGIVPQTRMVIGHVPVSQIIATPIIKATLKLIAWRHPELPQPEKLVTDVRFGDDTLFVRLSLPSGTKIFSRVAKILGNETDQKAVSKVYCTLADAQKRRPSDDFAVHVQRAFSLGGAQVGSDVVAANRSALLALPLFLGEPRSLMLFGGLTPDMERCALPSPLMVKLAGRTDLPHHWAVSAVLATSVGRAPTEAIGGWKELSDSLAGGSGYSFVDISADRSGFRFGQAAVDPARAAAIRARLQTVRNAELLPPAMLKLTENLSEAEFKQRYGDENSPQYRAKLAHIDTALDAAGVPR